MENKFSVSEFIAYCNQTLEYAYTGCTIEGEVLNVKTSQNKWVFFSLKDEGLGAWYTKAYKLGQV